MRKRPEQQDRSLWNREYIAEGIALVERALATRRFGPYTLQAAIAAVHAEASGTAVTDWNEIVGLYDALALTRQEPERRFLERRLRELACSAR